MKKSWLGVGLGILGGYVLAQHARAIGGLISIDVEHTLNTQVNRAPKGLAFSETQESETFVRTHTVEDGVERIVYVPKRRRFETPIVMQHGMWHGAWCWQLWQELFAEWGWETRAHSLPGHGRSVEQRPVKKCTLDYYLSFLKTELERSPCRPVLMGHSMGGALAQWHFKYVSDDLPAAVLVASWVSHSMVKDGLWRLVAYDPVGVLLMALTLDATPMVRPGRGSAARFLVGPRAPVSLDELQPRLGQESMIVLYQHNPPLWQPPQHVRTPLLWIAGEKDPLLTEAAERRSAAHYAAEYMVAEGARHNVMLEHNYRSVAQKAHDWLVAQGIQ